MLIFLLVTPVFEISQILKLLYQIWVVRKTYCANAFGFARISLYFVQTEINKVN